ncbi:MAG: hypothetical protein COA44_14925 [Arcobacter sp.]|nr:MAG: hypothetical protein COA44_14925 [Arcobacter sp.]
MSRVLSILFITSLLHLEAVQWMSLEEGLAKAKKSDKLIMMDVIRDGCHFCSDMDKNVFNDKNMSIWIESCFIPVKFNLSQEKLPNGLKVEVTPTFFFMNEKLELIKKIEGSWNKQDFTELSQKLCREN